MPEIMSDAKVFFREYLCDKCKKGRLITTKKVRKGIDESKAFVIHKCNNKECGEIVEFENKEYPRMECMPVYALEEMEKKKKSEKKENEK